jgi:hypothetical protein
MVVEAAHPIFTEIYCKLLKINEILVEAAGVEPASEIVVSRETPCLVHSVNSLHALRIDKKRMKLVR